MGENPGRIARWHTRRTERADLVNSTGRLTVATRTVLVLLGAAAISAATVATFKHLGGVVPTVLTIVGAVFVVLGGLGRQVDSVSLKEGGPTYSQWRDEVLDEPTPEGVLEAAVSAPLPVRRQFDQDRAVRRVTESAYEASIRGVLREKFGDALREQPVRVGPYVPDFVVEREGRRVLIECSYSRFERHDKLVKIVEAAAENSDGNTAIVFLSADRPYPSVIQRVLLAGQANSIRSEFIRWTPEFSPRADFVADFVEDMLAIPEGAPY